jgi:ubiquinol-cytochrome c reductase iron-sulfur subunit
VADLKPGEMKTVEWRGKPVWVLRRTPEMVASLQKTGGDLADPKSERNADDLTPDYARNEHRSIKPEFLVLYAACTHLGCLPKQYFTQGDPTLGADWPGGFFCPCHGSRFDLAGRVFNGSPASLNLAVPPHKFESDTMLVIGLDANAEGAA